MSERTVVVADAGPLISLASIRHLDLLHALFARVVVPPAVWREVVIDGGDEAPGAREVRGARWIETLPVGTGTPRSFRLGAGEAEAIALATSLGDVVLLLDDAAGRTAALHVGLRVLGTLGVLRQAKHARLILSVRPLVDDLLLHGFRATPRLVEAVLRDVGELEP